MQIFIYKIFFFVIITAMDQINPFTNAPVNPPPQPGAAPVPPQPAAQAKPTPPKPAEPQKKKSEFDIKHIVKTIVMVIIGIVVAKLAFDSVVPMFKPQPAAPSKTAGVKAAGARTASAPARPARGGKKGQAELSLSETFAAAKKAPKPPAQAQTEPYVVNGIFLSEGAGLSSAIINNKVVGVGETVDGATVTSISSEGVELMKDNEVIRLRYR